MKRKHLQNMGNNMHTRRDLLINFSSLVALSANPHLLFAAMREQHLDIVAKLKKLQKHSQPITILYPKGCLKNLNPVKEMVHDLTGVSIQLKEGSLDEISSEIALEAKTGKHSFDIALPPTFSIPNLAEKKLIADLSSFAEKLEPKNYLDTILYNRGDRFLGKLYGYQTDGDVYMLFLNKSWLASQQYQDEYQKRFQRPLEIPKTWSELDQQIQFFYRPDQDMAGGSLYRNRNYILWEYWIRLHSKGILPFDDEMNPQISNPEAIAALEELVAVSKYLSPETRNDGLFENFKSFGQGNKYCNLGWGGTQKYLNSDKSKIKDKLIFASPPGLQSSDQFIPIPYFNWGWNYCVSTYSKHPEMSYLICLLATTPYVSQRSIAEAGGYFDPYRIDHYQNTKIQATYGKDFLVAHQNALKDAIPDLYIQGQNRYLGALKQAVHASSLGHISPKQALTAVKEKWQRLTADLGQSSQSEQWKSLKKEYPEKFKRILRQSK